MFSSRQDQGATATTIIQDGEASPQPSATEEELVGLLTTSEPLVKFQWVDFVDSGGQPQFHEVLPIFLRGTSLCLFVFKLSEKLREHPVVECYNEEGKPLANCTEQPTPMNRF